MQFSYETAGNSSYLVATFEKGEGLINYQLQMLVNNDIKNVIAAAKKQKNDDIQIFYNITSKITLEQAIEKNKISKDGVIAIINGALSALKDLEEYQLVSSGIIFEENKIFVKPGHFEPNFIYIPDTTEDTGIQSLKNLLLSFVMGSKIEVSNDNFVQVLLETLNKPGFNASALKKMCEKYQGGGQVNKPKQRETKPEVNIPQPPRPQAVQTPPQAERPIQIPVAGGMQNKPPIPKQSEAPKKQEAPKKEKEKNSKKPVFLILQIVLLAVVAGLSFTGILNDESGNLNFQYLAGVLLGAGCIDFVLYREMFKNNKDKETKKEKEAKPKNVKKPSVAMPGKEMPAMPKSIPQMPKKPIAVPKKDVNGIAEQAEKNVSPKKVEYAIPSPAVVPPVSQTQAYDPLSEFENEDTVVIDNSASGTAYLEFYDNGIASRINLDRERIAVGKLRSQCDFVLNNRKISKMHAEFICRNGQYYVKDFNSTNGTYINGGNQRIQSNQEYQIYNGDRVTLADVDMTLFC